MCKMCGQKMQPVKTLEEEVKFQASKLSGPMVLVGVREPLTIETEHGTLNLVAGVANIPFDLAQELLDNNQPIWKV